MRTRAAACLGLALTSVFVSVLVSTGPASGAAPPRPRITVTPHNRLVDGQAVQVKATGLPPNRVYTFGECVAGAAAAGNADDPIRLFALCGYNAIVVTTDADGAATETLPVTRTFSSLGDGSARSCGGRGRRCVVVAGTLGSPFVETPIDFSGWVTCRCGPVSSLAPGMAPFGLRR